MGLPARTRRPLRLGAPLEPPDPRPRGRRAMLDLACGFGRHSRWLMRQGHIVTAVDRDAQGARHYQPTLTPWVRTAGRSRERALAAGRARVRGRGASSSSYLSGERCGPAILAGRRPAACPDHRDLRARQRASVGSKPSRPDFLLPARRAAARLRRPARVVALRGLASCITRAPRPAHRRAAAQTLVAAPDGPPLVTKPSHRLPLSALLRR